jgi:RecA-family ATPase
MPIDIMKCYTMAPPAKDYILPGMIPGTVGSIVAPGAAGKSMFALLLAHLIGGGVDLLGLGAFSTGQVGYISAEDGESILHERLHEIGSRLDIPQRIACAEAIQIEDLTHVSFDLLARGKKGTECREALERICKEKRLLFLDTLRSVHSGDENHAGDMSGLIGHLRSIAARTRCAIIFLHHSSKALAVNGQGDMQQASRGSSVLTDNIRWQGYLAGMSREESEQLSLVLNDDPIGHEQRGYYVRFGISKQNYGAPYVEKWYKRGEGGVLEPITLYAAKTAGTTGRKPRGKA